MLHQPLCAIKVNWYLAAVLFFFGALLHAQNEGRGRGEDDKHKSPENYHALYDPALLPADRTARVAEGAKTEGHKALQESFADLKVTYDEVLRVPNRVTRSAPNARVGRAAQSAEDAAAAFVQEHRAVWNLTPADTSTVEVVAVSERGLKSVRMRQRVGGVEVFGSDINVAVSPMNEVTSFSGLIFPGAGAETNRRSARAGGTPDVVAIAQALWDLTGTQVNQESFRTPSQRSSSREYRFYETPAADQKLARPVRVKDVLFPMSDGSFVPAYYIELWPVGQPAYSYVIAADDSKRILFRNNLTSHLVFEYRVHNTGDAISRPLDGPAPGTPHPTGQVDGFQAPTVPEQIIRIESLLAGAPWLAPTATTTDGNNCLAYADLGAPDGFAANTGDVLGKISSPGRFDYTYDHTKPASEPTNLQNSLVGMFFHVNWLHDRWYEAGFDEAAGNAQRDNFGRGGEDNDPILAEGNDFSGTDNANMSTPADGASPQMQMYEFTGPPGASRTSNHEALITFHEMGHYITNRLVGNANGLNNTQGRAMGEGWGDLFAGCMTSQASDNFATGVFAVGGWTDITSSFKENYYFSIRRYPYSADLTKNPLTFKHIALANALPSGPQAPKRNPLPWISTQNSEVHNAGEVWCATLWEVFVGLVRDHGHQVAEARMLEYVIGGLKQTPNNPTYTEARDGIITAVSALHSEDLKTVWQGFAKRGMGAGAVAPPRMSSTLNGVVESFTIPTELNESVPSPAPETPSVPRAARVANESLTVTLGDRKYEAATASAERSASGAPVLMSVVQTGREFERAHPEAKVLVNKGRHLLIDGRTLVTRSSEDDHDYKITPVTESTKVFERMAGADLRIAQDPKIVQLLSQLSADQFKTDVKTMAAFPNRHSTTANYANASRWAADELTSQGYNVQFHGITVGGKPSRNVIATKAGETATSKVLLVTAHLDSINHFGGPTPQAEAPGADDNASGSAGVLQMARALKSATSKHELRFILFGGEEQGLFGSTQYVASLTPTERSRIECVLNMDMIATKNQATASVLVEGSDKTPAMKAMVTDLVAAAASYSSLQVDISFNPFNSDHVPFIDAGIPAVLTIEGADSANGNVHTINDSLDKVDPQLATEILKMNLAFVATKLELQ